MNVLLRHPMAIFMWYVISFFWLIGFLFLWKIPFPEKNANHPPPGVPVSVIVPARNEERNLARLLESIDRQLTRPEQVIVADDESEDATVEIAQRHGCTVIRAGKPPEGWLGKTWACWQGAQAAASDILLFLDSDTFLEREAMARLWSIFSAKDGLLTVQPFHRIEKNYERLAAFFNIIVMAGLNAFTPLQSRIKPGGAFGPCMMCRKEDYFATGGHELAKNAILESIPIGRKFVDAGIAVHCYGGKGTISFRMYPEGVGSMVEGLSKAFAAGAKAISTTTLVMIVCWVFGAFSLTRHLIQSALEGHLTAFIGWAALDVMYAAQIQWMLARIGSFGLRTAVFFQIPLVFFTLIFALSVVKTVFVRRVRWKGRVVDTD